MINKTFLNSVTKSAIYDKAQENQSKPNALNGISKVHVITKYTEFSSIVATFPAVYIAK